MNRKSYQIFSIPWKGIFDWVIGNRLHILMYHSISENPNDPHAIDPKDFVKHMQFLQDKRVISLIDAIRYLKESKTLKDYYVISFDDGLLDFYESALPIIKDYGYPVTMFLPTELIGKKATWDSYDKTKPLMNWELITESQQWDVDFGSHTALHSRLTTRSYEEIRKELVLSYDVLHARLQNFVPALAYPGGYYDKTVIEIAMETGYICGLGASSRWGNGAETDIFSLRREKLKL